MKLDGRNNMTERKS